MTEDERLEEIDRLKTALEELCSPYRSADMAVGYDDVIKEMPETEQAMAIHMMSELEHLERQGSEGSDH